MTPESSNTRMLPPCAGSSRTATASGTPWYSSPVTPTSTIWWPSGRRYCWPTCWAICCAPAVPCALVEDVDRGRLGRRGLEQRDDLVPVQLALLHERVGDPGDRLAVVAHAAGGGD